MLGLRATIILGVFWWLMIGAVARGADAADKAAIPDAVARDKALKLVAEIYEKPWKEARTSAEKTALAGKMIDAAMKAQGDAAGRFVLLRVARDISVEAGDAATASRAIDLLDGDFQIDAAEMKTAAILEAAKSAVTEDHHRAIADGTFALVEAAVDKDQYDTAERLVRVAQSSARKLREGEKVRAYTDLSRDVERIARAYKRIAPQREVLDEKPTDPEANLAVGKFLCFDKGDWRRGIPMLVLGSDKELATLAEKELRNPETAEEQVAIADAWWDRAEKADETAKKLMQLHAGTWYEKALPGLGAGLTKAKVEKRLEDLQERKPTDALGLAGTINPGEAVPAGKWVDVLPWIVVEADRAGGSWAEEEGSIVVRPTGGAARLNLPVRVQGSYDLRIDFTSPTGGSSVLILPVGAKAVNAYFSAKLHGLHWIDGRDTASNATARRDGVMITGGDYRVELSVRVAGDKASVSARLNGQPCFGWQGRQASLSSWAPAGHDRPGIGGWNSHLIYRRALFRLVAGKAVRVDRPELGQ